MAEGKTSLYIPEEVSGVVFVEGHYFGSEVLRQRLGLGKTHRELTVVKQSTLANDGVRRQLLTRIDQIAGTLGSVRKFFFTGCSVDVGANIAKREFGYQRCCLKSWRYEMATRLGKLNGVQHFLFLGSRGHCYTSRDDICNAIESRLKTGTSFIYLTESKVLDKEIDEGDFAVIDILRLVRRYRGQVQVYRLDTCSFLSDEELDRILSMFGGVVLYT